MLLIASLTSSVNRKSGTAVEAQFKQLCTPAANVGVHVVVQLEGGFCCVWEMVWHSVVHYGSGILKILVGPRGSEDAQH